MKIKHIKMEVKIRETRESNQSAAISSATFFGRLRACAAVALHKCNLGVFVAVIACVHLKPIILFFKY